MIYEKITDKDLQGKGVIGLPDTPELTAQAMQEKFEETARSVIIPKFNLLIDSLTAGGQPVQSENVMLVRIGENGDLQMSADGTTWKDVTAKALESKADISDVYTKEETDGVVDRKLESKADKSSVYTKAETNEAISARVTEIGAGDMAKAVYDTDNNGIVDNAEKLGGHNSDYFATAESVAEIETSVADVTATATAAQTTANNAMPKAGGTFTGNAKAATIAGNLAGVRNMAFYDSNGTVTTDNIVFIKCYDK